MSPDPTLVRHVIDWLFALGEDLQLDEAAAVRAGKTVPAHATHLAGQIPGAFFTEENRLAFAATLSRFPTPKQSTDFGREWVKEHPQPRLRQLPGDPSFARWSDMDHHWLKYWHTRAAENFAPSGDSGVVASLLRQHSPRAWAHITGVPERPPAPAPEPAPPPVNDPGRSPTPENDPEPPATPPRAEKYLSPEQLVATWKQVADDPRRPESERDRARSRVAWIENHAVAA